MTKCYYCDDTLTEEEIDYLNEHAEFCCSGRECGCMGLPIDPPSCFKCEPPSKESKYGQEKGNQEKDGEESKATCR